MIPRLYLLLSIFLLISFTHPVFAQVTAQKPLAKTNNLVTNHPEICVENFIFCLASGGARRAECMEHLGETVIISLVPLTTLVVTAEYCEEGNSDQVCIDNLLYCLYGPKELDSLAAH